MSRGNQRERDRQKNQAKLAAKSKGDQREGTPSQRNANDKDALLAKIEAKKAAKAASADAQKNTKAPVARKKVAKKDDSLDDLLNAGLTKGKKGKK